MWRKMLLWLWLPLVLWASTWAQHTAPANSPEGEEVVAVAGGRVLLPCDLDPPSPEHPVTQVDFLRKYDTYSSIYRIHTQGGPLARATHWVPDRFLERALVVTTGGEDERGLVLEDVTVEDEGGYQCRVKYRGAPPTVTGISLRVVVEPSKVVLFSDADPRKVIQEVAGPYSPGEVVTLSCQVTGGYPRPKVTWWEGSHLLDDVSEHQSGEVTRNDVTLEPLTRADLNRRLTCQASNAEVTEPLTSAVTLDLHYPPSSVRIMGEEGGEVVVRAAVQQDLMCQVLGSRPPPIITWRINGVPHTGKRQQVSLDGKVTSSTLSLTPGPEQDGSQVTCSAHNPELTHNAITASTKLSVLYMPQVELRRGLNINFDDIEEGDDLFFTCYVRANPPPTDVQWTHDGEAVVGDPTEGVYVRDSTLVLQAVTRGDSGHYSCTASNTEGAASSNTLLLQVKFAPVCAMGQEAVVPAAAHVQVTIGCSVAAHPPPTSFRWTMNTSVGEVDVPASQYHWAGLRSGLPHTPPTQHYYRRLRCWAANQVGEQRKPCQTYVVPATAPEAVLGCTVTEPATVEVEEVEVECEPGADGGLSQTFTLEVQHPDNVTEVQHENLPVFTVKRLRVGVQYMLVVTAANARGASPPYNFTFIASRTSVANSPAGQVAPKSPSWFHLVVAMAVVLLAGSVVVPACPRLLAALIMWRIYRGRPDPTHTHRDPHALLNGDPSRVVLLSPPPPSSAAPNGSFQPFARSSTPTNHMDEYLERERSRFLLMGSAPRASLDSLELSTAPPSVYSDPLRSLQPSPFIVDPGPEKLFVGGGGEEEEEEEDVAAGEEGNTVRATVVAAEAVGGDNPAREALLKPEEETTRGTASVATTGGGAVETPAPPRIPPLETSFDDNL